MRVLASDLSTGILDVAVVDVADAAAPAVLSRFRRARSNDDVPLAFALRAALGQAGVAPAALAGIAVGVGPGETSEPALGEALDVLASFALRVPLPLVSLESPLVLAWGALPVLVADLPRQATSALALRASHRRGPLRVACALARGERVVVAVYLFEQAGGEPVVLRPPRLLDRAAVGPLLSALDVDALVGDGAVGLGLDRKIPAAAPVTPSAVDIALCARARLLDAAPATVAEAAALATPALVEVPWA